MNPSNEPSDDELREALHALRREGERRAPAFQDIWRAARQLHRTSAPSWRLAWAAVAVAVVVALFIVTAGPRRQAPVAPAPVATVPSATAPLATALEAADGELPTDFLLTTNHADPVDRVAGEIDALLRP